MEETFIRTVATELKIIRFENGYSQEEVAEKSGIATSSISKYESGIGNMKISTLEQLLKVYNIDLNIFFTRVIAKKQK